MHDPQEGPDLDQPTCGICGDTCDKVQNCAECDWEMGECCISEDGERCVECNPTDAGEEGVET